MPWKMKTKKTGKTHIPTQGFVDMWICRFFYRFFDFRTLHLYTLPQAAPVIDSTPSIDPVSSSFGSMTTSTRNHFRFYNPSHHKFSIYDICVRRYKSPHTHRWRGCYRSSDFIYGRRWRGSYKFRKKILHAPRRSAAGRFHRYFAKRTHNRQN